jgi:hypothetical protein
MSPNRTATGRKGYFLSDDSTIVSGRTEKVCLSSARCSSFAKLHSNFHWTKLWDSIISAGEIPLSSLASSSWATMSSTGVTNGGQ